MKKVVSFFLAIVIAFNSVVLLFFYLGQIEQCKYASISLRNACYPSGNTLQEFSSDDKYVHLIDEDELIVKGKFFDIAKKEIRKGKTIYFAYSDDKEDGFIAAVSELTGMNSNGKNLPVKITVPEFSKYTRAEKIDLLDVFINRICNDLATHSNDLFSYNSPHLNIFSPPPDIFS